VLFRYGADASVIGRQISANGRTVTVAAVIRDEDCYPPGVDAWVPLPFTPSEEVERAAQRIAGIGRLTGGASMSVARGQLAALAGRLAAEYPLTNRNRRFDLLPMRSEQYEFTAPLFLFVQAAALLVLLLAAVNVAGLFIARMLERREEVAIRAMLGAGRREIGSLVASELFVVALFATGIGLASAGAVLTAIRASLPEGIARWVAGWSAMRIDTAAMGSGVAFGAAVAIVLGGAIALAAIRSAEPGANIRITRRRGWGWRALACAEMGLAAALLLGASATVQGFNRLSAAFAAIAPDGLLRFTLTLPESRYPDNQRLAAMHSRLLDALRADSQVAAAALIRNEPASNVPNPVLPLQIAEAPALSPADMPRADVQVVSPDLFALLHLTLIDGRGFTGADTATAPRVAVVSQEAARRFWNGRIPVGASIRFAGDPVPLTVVGIVSDFMLNWYDLGVRPVVYLADAQSPPRTASIVIRTRMDPILAARQVRAAVAEIDDHQPLAELEPLETAIADSLSPVRIIERLLSAGAALAAVLAAIGIYGVLARSVSARRREFGVRFALGATRPAIASLVLAEASLTSGAAIAVGIVIAAAVVHLAQAALLGIPALDVRGTAAVFAAASAVALAAALAPALRAARVDVVRLLRLD